MNTEDIARDGTLEPVVEATAVRDAGAAPAVTHEEYLELATLRQRQNELKLQGWDVQDFVRRAKEELDIAEGKLGEIREELDTTTATLQTRFSEVVSPHGFTGMVTIADTEPHVITQQNNG